MSRAAAATIPVTDPPQAAKPNGDGQPNGGLAFGVMPAPSHEQMKLAKIHEIASRVAAQRLVVEQRKVDLKTERGLYEQVVKELEEESLEPTLEMFPPPKAKDDKQMFLPVTPRQQAPAAPEPPKPRVLPPRFVEVDDPTWAAIEKASLGFDSPLDPVCKVPVAADLVEVDGRAWFVGIPTADIEIPTSRRLLPALSGQEFKKVGPGLLAQDAGPQYGAKVSDKALGTFRVGPVRDARYAVRHDTAELYRRGGKIGAPPAARPPEPAPATPPAAKDDDEGPIRAARECGVTFEQLLASSDLCNVLQQSKGNAVPAVTAVEVNKTLYVAYARTDKLPDELTVFYLRKLLRADALDSKCIQVLPASEFAKRGAQHPGGAVSGLLVRVGDVEHVIGPNRDGQTILMGAKPPKLKDDQPKPRGSKKNAAALPC